MEMEMKMALKGRWSGKGRGVSAAGELDREKDADFAWQPSLSGGFGRDGKS
jgi:hypothetical protein